MCDILKSANIPKIISRIWLVPLLFRNTFNNSKFKMQGIDLLADKIVDVGH